MNVNLATAYDPQPSPPHDTRLVFYSKQNGDLLFTDEEEVEIYCQAGFRQVGLNWTLARNGFKKTFAQGTAQPHAANSFLMRIPACRLKPGFYDLRVELDLGNGTVIPGITTFGYQAGKMRTAQKRPADFESFWNAAKRELAQVSLNPVSDQLTRFHAKDIDDYNQARAGLPQNYDPTGCRCNTVEAGKVHFAGMGGSRIHGYLAKPLGEGPFPGMLVLPGAGFAARPMPFEHARHGYMALDIQVHGQDVDLSEYPRLQGYYENWVFEPPQAYYFYNVYLNALQALNYLAARPEVDNSRMVVVGGSQGGRLAVVMAGLDSRVAAAVSAIANSGNVPYRKWAAACNGWLPPQDGMDQNGPPALPDTPEGRCLGYYDPMSFAPDVRCPVLMNAGLIDPISPPSDVFPVYQQLGSADKTITALPGLGHDWSSEFDRSAWRWLDRVLKMGLTCEDSPAVVEDLIK